MNRVASSTLPVVALTHPGMKGKNNEDRYGVTAFQIPGSEPTPVLLAILSDGIGGHRAGEVASAMAVDAITEYAAESDGKYPPQILQEAIHQASQKIRDLSQENSDYQGMGATCACVWITKDRLYTATVGDSRIYLMRGSVIEQLSTDHTWIKEALDRGLIQPDQVEGHPNAHVIRRYLGSPTPPEVDFRMQLAAGEDDAQAVANQGAELLAGDHILLCSDGLTDLVKDEEILGAYLSMPQAETAQYLVNLANQRGGHDNITLVSIELPPEPTIQMIIPPIPTKRKRFLNAPVLAGGCLGVILLGVIVGGVLGGWFLNWLPLPTQPTLTVTITLTLPQQATLPADVLPGTTATLPVTPTSALRVTPSPTMTPWRMQTATAPLPVVTVTATR